MTSFGFCFSLFPASLETCIITLFQVASPVSRLKLETVLWCKDAEDGGSVISFLDVFWMVFEIVIGIVL